MFGTSKHYHCGLKLPIVVFGTPQNMLRFPYFRKEGGGQVVKQNVLIFNVFIRGRREGFKANKTNACPYIFSLFG